MASRDPEHDAAPTAPGQPPRVVDGRLVISDPRGMRVLAHEARLAILEELGADGAELTASELAGRVGLSPSALSYHLRLLERYGVLRRGAGRDDGRERPWVRVAGSIVIESPGSTAGMAAQSTVISQVLRTVQAHWDEWIAVEDDQPKVWQDAATVVRARLWLTSDEATELTAALDASMAPYRSRRDRAARPPAAREVELVTMVVPRPPDPATEA